MDGVTTSMGSTLRQRLARLRALLPHGGSLPDSEWLPRHKVITGAAWLTVPVVATYAILAHGTSATRYLPEVSSLILFASLSQWTAPSRKWRSVAASMALLTASASLVDISRGLIEMHFAFFVAIVVLTVYEDWLPFLLAVAFVLLHHGVMGTLDPRAVFDNPAEWKAPWAWASLHAFFVALAGAAAVIAWGLNERVRERMRAAQAELQRISLTDPLTSLNNRRKLMTDLDALYERNASGVLAIFDLDGFKDYNDRFGHPAGDSLLTRLAARLNVNVRDVGQAYRLGGDEFCVLAELDAPVALDELVPGWTGSFTERGEGFSISASSGAALLPQEAHDPSEALRVCDRRMYLQKHGGRATAATQSKNVLLAALAARHSELRAHVNDVAAIASKVGTELGLHSEALQELAYAAELHDIGKVAIPDSIISKPGPLDEEEWEFMRRHTLIGERILAVSPALARVGKIVRATHERFDGLGYPDGLRADEIPLAASIISACDAYDAIVSERPYRPARDHTVALAELTSCAGTQFHPQIVAALTKVLESGAHRADVPAAAAAVEAA